MKGKLSLDVTLKKPKKADRDNWQMDECFCCNQPSGPKYLDLYRFGKWAGQLCQECFTTSFEEKGGKQKWLKTQ